LVNGNVAAAAAIAAGRRPGIVAGDIAVVGGVAGTYS